MLQFIHQQRYSTGIITGVCCCTSIIKPGACGTWYFVCTFGPSPQSQAKQATSCPTSCRHATRPTSMMLYGIPDHSLVDTRPAREVRDAGLFWVRHREMLVFLQVPKRCKNGGTFRVHSDSHKRVNALNNILTTD